MSNLEEVFKVGGMPTVTFVEPVEYPALIVALRTAGRSVVVEGPSGIGKTTSVHKALKQLNMADNVILLSARKKDDKELIAQLPTMKDLGVVVIDDFHILDDEIKRQIADYMKVLADEEIKESKIVILGINQAGQSLVNFAHDLNNRLEIISFESNPEHKIDELLEKGERELNLKINIKNDIVNASHGSFYIAQMLAHQTCLDSGILERKKDEFATKVSFELVKGKVFDKLSRNFKDRTLYFSRGTKLKREGRAPYLHLLFWLSKSTEWNISIDEALVRHPELKGSVVQIVDKGYLERLIEGSDELRAVLHFDSTNKLLSVEDPQYVYYLRNISWSKFAKEAGFMTMEFPCPYDFALSFAGSNRSVAEAIFKALSEMEFEVFYDLNEQHRLLAEDIEDYLRPIYMSDAQYVIVLLGPDYPKRVWTRFESQNFRDRFKENAVIPMWFDTVPEGTFDDTNRVGGFLYKTEEDLSKQVHDFSELCRNKIAEVRRANRP